MKNIWKLADVVDLEYFLHSDVQSRELEGEQALKRRDRAIYLSRQQEFAEAVDSRSLIRRWLDVRRMQQTAKSTEITLPGDAWRETASLTRWLTLFLGLCIGGGIASALLTYTGEAAVNVSGYFSLFILFQLLILIMQLLLFFIRFVSRSGIRSSIFCKLAAGVIRKLFLKLQRRSHYQSSGESRLALQAIFGQLKQNRQEYRNLYFWPAFVLLQLFGASFNLGVLTTTLAKVSISDIAFGWQSTLQIDPTFLAEVIRLIATPWSWLVPQHLAYPTLEQIEGSKIILKEGIYHLSTRNLVAWWPFLTLGVITYGLLPRLFLLMLGFILTRRSLNGLCFDTARFRQLQQRMLTPALQTQASHTIIERKKTLTTGQPPPLSEEITALGILNQGSKLLLIPDELWDDLNKNELKEQLLSQEGGGPYQPLRIGEMGQTEEQLFIQVAENLHKNSATGVVLLQEAWQPPIREVLALLRRMRHEIPRNYPVTVALIGKPSAVSMLTPVKTADLKVWRKTLQGLADPYLTVYPLVSDI